MIRHIEPSIWWRTSMIRAASPPTSTLGATGQRGAGTSLVAQPLDQRDGSLGIVGRRRPARSIRAAPARAVGGGDRRRTSGSARRLGDELVDRLRGSPPASVAALEARRATSTGFVAAAAGLGGELGADAGRRDRRGTGRARRCRSSGREHRDRQHQQDGAGGDDREHGPAHHARPSSAPRSRRASRVVEPGAPAAADDRRGGSRGSPTRRCRPPRRGGRGSGSAPAAARSRPGSRRRPRSSPRAPSSAASGCRPSRARQAR